MPIGLHNRQVLKMHAFLVHFCMYLSVCLVQLSVQRESCNAREPLRALYIYLPITHVQRRCKGSRQHLNIN